MLDAAVVARNAGLPLRQKGARLWTCCPLHGEKTPSMCFFPDGKYHCFGCGAHGDAADLYAALHGVSLAEALRSCKHTLPRQNRKVQNTREKVEGWFSEQWSAACKSKHNARESMEHSANQEAYWLALERYARAVDWLNHLDSVKDDPVGKTMLFVEATSEKR